MVRRKCRVYRQQQTHILQVRDIRRKPQNFWKKLNGKPVRPEPLPQPLQRQGRWRQYMSDLCAPATAAVPQPVLGAPAVACQAAEPLNQPITSTEVVSALPLLNNNRFWGRAGLACRATALCLTGHVALLRKGEIAFPVAMGWLDVNYFKGGDLNILMVQARALVPRKIPWICRVLCLQSTLSRVMWVSRSHRLPRMPLRPSSCFTEPQVLLKPPRSGMMRQGCLGHCE